jgi:hypothetical protein
MILAAVFPPIDAHALRFRTATRRLGAGSQGHSGFSQTWSDLVRVTFFENMDESTEQAAGLSRLEPVLLVVKQAMM